MANFNLLNSEVKPLTRDLAEQFQNMEPSPTEREFDSKRIGHLRTKAAAGHLINFNWSCAKLGDRLLRMNGQHSSAMLSQLNGEFPGHLFVHLDTYEVDDEEGLALLFRQFDDRKSARSPMDISGAYQMLHQELRNVPRATAKIGIEGVVWYLRTVEGAPMPSGDDIFTLFSKRLYYPFLLWLGNLLNIKTPELKNLHVVAAMYSTFVKNEREARIFWDQVARGGLEYGEDENAPSALLDIWLKKAKQRELKVAPKPGQFYQGCIYAWNAYRGDKQMKTIQSDTSKSWLMPSE